MVQVHKYSNTEEDTTIEVEGGVIVLGELTEKDKLATDTEEKMLTNYFTIEVATVDQDKRTKESAKLVIRTEDFPKVVDEIVKFRQLHLK
jgi:hypothetical protein